MVFTIIIPDNFASQFDELDDKTRNRVIQHLDELDDNPKRGKKFQGKNDWSDRIGDFRLIYLVDWQSGTITPLSIDKRGRVYKRRI